ncbi:MAG: phage protein NinX family protein [Hafnia sp.]
MDYSNLSDFEINKLVDVAFHGETTPMRTQSLDFGITNYCINADQAWPIIKENMISLCAYKRANPGMKSVSWWEADNFGDHITRDNNPLRAAMIVYLLLQESLNVPANSTGSDIR